VKILITGGAGFIGSHLAEAHIKNGDEVFVIDDLSTGSLQNVEHLRRYPKFHDWIESICHSDALPDLIDSCDVVYHLAAAVGVRLIVDSPVRTIETNVRGTEIVLNLAARKRKRVLVASTSEVYGKREQVPFKETDDLIMGPSNKGRWSYACSKAIDEFLALAYFKEKKVPTIVVRLFNTVGPRQTGRYGMVVPNFVRQALAGEPITVYGDGRQRRCFAHVSDVVGALMQLALHPKAAGEIFNIGNAEEISIADLARRVKHLTQAYSDIVFLPYEEVYEEGFEDMQRRIPDLTKVGSLIGYTPRVGLNAILTSVIDYQRHELFTSPGEGVIAHPRIASGESASANAD